MDTKAITGINNNLVDFIKLTMNAVLKYFRHYDAKVMSIDENGTIKAHILELGTSEDDQQSWIICYPSNNLYSAIRPDVNDYVSVYFPSGNSFKAYYSCHSPLYQESINGGNNKYVVFEYDDIYIVYDKDNLLFKIVVNGLEIIFNKNNNKILINGDIDHTGDLQVNGDLFVDGRISATGNIQSNVDVIVGSISLKNHKHGGVTTGSGQTSPPI